LEQKERGGRDYSYRERGYKEWALSQIRLSVSPGGSVVPVESHTGRKSKEQKRVTMKTLGTACKKASDFKSGGSKPPSGVETLKKGKKRGRLSFGGGGGFRRNRKKKKKKRGGI